MCRARAQRPQAAGDPHSRSPWFGAASRMQPTDGGGVVSSGGGASTDADPGDGSEAAAGGPELPLHLTEKILCSISPLASARHATVCRSWLATVSARLARPVPHLFVCTPPDISSRRRGLVVSVPLAADDEQNGAAPTAAVVLPSRVRASDTHGLRCVGAARGSGRVAFAAGWWSTDVVLADPVTGAHQRVAVGEPRLDPRHSRVVANGGTDERDAFFAVEGYKLVLWRTDKAAQWSKCAVTATLSPTNNIVSAVDCNGRFYLLHEDGALSTVDATAPPPLRLEKLPAVRSLDDQFGAGRLLECDGEVLFARQLLAFKQPDQLSAAASTTSVAGFEVHRLDAKAQRWTKVDRLPPDRALFVSPGSSFAVRASEVEGCRSDCVYFAGENQYYSSPACREYGETSWGLYSMERRRVLSEHLVVTEPGTGAEVVWFLPRVRLGGLCKSLIS